MTILVAYASRLGSTATVAEAIADALRESGEAIDLRCVGDVREIAGYTAAVALFCVYISSPPQVAREAYLDDVRGFVRPVSEGFFTGRFDRRGAALLIPKALAWLVPPIDRRDWRAIREWARSLPPLLAATTPREEERPS